jgi:hypothetical protein
MAGIIGHYGKVIRLVGRQDITVQYASPPVYGVVAWTDSVSAVYLNIELVSDEVEQNIDDPMALATSIATIHAALHHELCHILYTPSPGHILRKKLEGRRSVRLFAAWNSLEDQRIESLYVKRFRVFKQHFTGMVARWVLGNNVNDPSAYTAVAGRRYLDSTLHAVMRSNFAANYGNDVANEVDAIVAAYKAASFGTMSDADADAIIDLIDRFSKVVPSTPPENSTGHETYRPAGGTSSPEDIDGNEESAEASDGDDGAADFDPDEGSSDGTDTGTSTDEQPDGTLDDDVSDSDEEADAESGSGDIDDPSNTEPSDGDGKSSNASDDVKSAAESALEDVNDRWDAYEDIMQTSEGIDAAGRSGLTRDRLPRSTPDIDVSSDISANYGKEVADAKAAVRRIESFVRRIRNELEPSAERGLSRGRLDFKRLAKQKMSGKPGVDVFKRNTPDREDDVLIDVSILMDASGSMDGAFIALANIVCWSLKRAFDRMAMPCNVIEFASNAFSMYDHDEKAPVEPVGFFNGGGTDPTEGLIASRAFFARPDASPSKLVVVITDGAFLPYYTGAGAVLDRLNADPSVTTALVGIGGMINGMTPAGRTESPETRALIDWFDVSHDIGSNVLDIIPAIYQIVRHIIKSKTND